MYTVGVDVGGTFTDFVVFDQNERRLVTGKVPSTPADPSLAVLSGLESFFPSENASEEIETFLHGTTVTTNALIQQSGPAAGLVLTGGMRGLYQVQTQMKVGPRYSVRNGRAPSLIDDVHVFEVPERVGSGGEVVLPLDEDSCREVGRAIAAAGLQSIAICFLFSFANPDHEQRARELIALEAPNCKITCSSDVLPRIREWPRMSMTILDAYLQPILVDYIAALEEGLVARGALTKKTYLMESNGGLMPFRAVTAGSRAVQTVLSGPAAAVQAVKRLAEVSGTKNLVMMDIGGTSCDIAFVQDGVALEATAGTVSGYDLYSPMLEITTIGAGGGTIARIDADERLQVGPASAGAEPGPAAYAKGGEEATITDADIVLGYLDPNYFLGGRLPLDAERSRAAVHSKVAEPLGISVHEAAEIMVRVNDAHMADAIRVVAAKAGVPLTECALVACGGAGPLHAAGVALELGIKEILIPSSPGVFAALGLLCTDVMQDYVQTDIANLASLSVESIISTFKTIERRATVHYEAQGFDLAEVEFVREVDARYGGQGFEVRVAVDDLGDPGLVEEIVRSFHAQYSRIYGHASEEEAVEIVSYRVRAVVRMQQYRPVPLASSANSLLGDRSRTVIFDEQALEAQVVRRIDLGVGQVLTGPAIIEQEDTTTVVPPQWTVTHDVFGTIVMTRGSQ